MTRALLYIKFNYSIYDTHNLRNTQWWTSNTRRSITINHFHSMLIVYLPILWIIPWLGSCWTWGGGYEQTTQTVYVCEQQDKTVQEFIKQHEIGHYVWFHLTEVQREKYRKLFSTAKVFYRDYSKTVLEDFADNYALLKLNQTLPWWQYRLLFIKKS